MSSFRCEKCGTLLFDTEEGCKTYCDHYPLEDYLREPTIIDKIAAWDNREKL